nr:hypothetical protein [uncultured Acetobacterium sp.]
MLKQQSSKYSLFLLELIIVIFFFAISSAVCVQLYAKAHVLSTSTRELNIAITKAEGAAEIIKSDPIHPETALSAAFSEASLNGQSIQLGFNKNWEVCSLSDAYYLMQIDWEQKDQMLMATVQIDKKSLLYNSDEVEIYKLDVTKHIQNKIN